MDISDILKDIMIDRNLKQVEMAKLIGVKQGQLTEWINGKCKPGYDNLRMICKGLGISGDEILGLK